MSMLAFFIGITMTTTIGWLLLAVSEGRSPVLGRAERVAYALVFGPTAAMFVVFLCHIYGLTKLNLSGFLVPQIVMILILGIAAWKRGAFVRGQSVALFVPKKIYPLGMTFGIALLCVWTALKIIAGSYDLVSVPTYWDDSFNNWNMRAKMFTVTEVLTLEIPGGNGVTMSAQGVGSYPPMVPLMKTWVSVLRGRWHEGLANGIHVVWFLGLIGVLYFTLRRFVDPLLSALGIWALVSLPLVLIHGSNPYADIVVAAHIVVAVAALLGLKKAIKRDTVLTWSTLFFLSLALLVFTKNEGLVLHLPLLLLTAVAFSIRRNNLVSLADHRRAITNGFLIVATVVLPWVLFKWSEGLTFGNAKAVGEFSLAFNPHVPKAIWLHLSHQPNWLLLPLVLPLAFIAAGKKFWTSPEACIGAFVLAEISVQCLIFLFVPNLGTEAVNQTGISRGLLHIMPVAILLLFLLLRGILKRAMLTSDGVAPIPDMR